MNDDRFLTKVFDSSRSPKPGVAGGSSVPSALLHQGARRIPLVAAVFIGFQFVGWVFPLAVRGVFLEEFTRVWDWLPPTTAIVASTLLIVVTRGARVSSRTAMKLGLLYQVIASYAIAFGQWWGSFAGFTANQINGDTLGMSAVGIWMLFFTVLVPARPRHALVALLGSATAPGVVFYLSAGVGDAPVLAPQQFFFVLVFPYLLVTVSAYIAARIMYRLGQAVDTARELGGYRLEDLLGKGGMGEVWRASHRMLARPAAAKLISRDALGLDPDTYGTALARFEREAQVTAALESPHTVDLYDYGVADDGTLYYVMELLDGMDLQQLVVRHGAQPAARVVHILKQACASLREAHRMGLVHRDVKPANIYLCTRAFQHDFVKVLDFGLVRRHAAVEAEERANDLSEAGMIVGTPHYMAPEVITGAPADARSDIFALGCVAYWLLTGEHVFGAPSLPGLLVAQASEVPVPPSERVDVEIPEDLEILVLDCLARDPIDRVQSADEILERLSRIELEDGWSQERAEGWWRGVGGRA